MTKLAQQLIRQAKAEKRTLLDLGNCGLREIPKEVFELEGLEELYLRNRGHRDFQTDEWVECKNEGEPNKIADIPKAIGALQQLTGLYIGGEYHNRWGIKDISSLSALSNLQELNLSHNQIFEVHPLSTLSNLRELNLSENQISDVAPLSTLSNLQQLNLSHNQISDVHPLVVLSNLQELNLWGNQISDIHPLSTLSNLQELNLWGNQISDIHLLSTLSNLRELNLSHNQISDVAPLSALSNLQQLYLIENQISDVAPLSTLSNLQELNLSHNQISDVVPLSILSNLQQLDLFGNQISDVAPLSTLSNLQQLSLSKNKISDIHPLAALQKLQKIDLQNNGIKDLRPLHHLIQNNIPIKWGLGLEDGIYVDNNPWHIPPIEIVKDGSQTVLDYFEAIAEQGVDYLYEAKMLILGEGGAGKTTLARKLQNPQATLPTEDETTKGIAIQPLTFNCDDQQTFTINIWDFGGQEIYHATHQFFLTKRSLYILVDDTRKDPKRVDDATLRYWLQTVELFGGNSPLLFVQNEKADRSKDIDIKGIKARFDFVKEKYAFNFATHATHLADLKKDIQHFIQKLPHIGDALPKQWVKIRSALLEKAKTTPYLSNQEYFAICRKHRINNKKQALRLSQYLHDLGTFLHFQKDLTLKKTLILQNEWATAAVYRVLDCETIKANKGRFTQAEAIALWSDEAYEEMQGELLRLMLNFELCYQLDLHPPTYLIPQLLPESQPADFSWDKQPNLQLRYHYRFMPKGLLSRFIVRMHQYVPEVDNCWKNGVVLQKNQAYGLVTETFAKNEIAIRVRGTQAKELMTLIAAEMDKLHRTYEGIKVEKRIPCNCSTCQTANPPHFFNYQEVLKRIEDHKYTIECSQKPYDNVSVWGLIDDLFAKFDWGKSVRGWKEGKEEVFMRYRPQKQQKTEDMVAVKGQLCQWVAENKFEMALKRLQAITPQWENEIVLLLSNHNDVAQREMLGTLKGAERTKQRNQLALSILQLVGKLT